MEGKVLIDHSKEWIKRTRKRFSWQIQEKRWRADGRTSGLMPYVADIRLTRLDLSTFKSLWILCFSAR